MKRKAIAGALVAAASLAGTGAANADDSLRLYGVVGAGPGIDIIKYKGKTYSKSGMQSGLSLFGFEGRHDLGDGLSTRFTLESGVALMSGEGSTSRLFSRMATLGLAHKRYGSIDVGRHYNMAALYMGKVDPFGGSYGLGGDDSTVNAGVRVDNLVLYQTPNVGGWQGGIGYSFGVNDVAHEAQNQAIIKALNLPPGAREPSFFNNKNTRLFTTGIQYAAGPLTAVATYDLATRRSDAPNAGDDRRLQTYLVGGAYSLSPFTVYGSFSQVFGGWMSAKNLDHMPTGDDEQFRDFKFAGGFKATSMMVGASYETGPHRIMASWQQARPNNKRLTNGDSRFDVYAMAYKYQWSKRTRVSIYGGYATNFAFMKGLKGMSAAVRLRHYF